MLQVEILKSQLNTKYMYTHTLSVSTERVASTLSKVSSIPNLLYTMTTALTFELLNVSSGMLQRPPDKKFSKVRLLLNAPYKMIMALTFEDTYQRSPYNLNAISHDTAEALIRQALADGINLKRVSLSLTNSYPLYSVLLPRA